MYLFSVCPEGYKGLVIPTGETYASYDCLLWNGPKGESWKAPRLTWLEDEFTSEGDKVADFTSFGGGPIAVSDKAYNILKELFAGQVEFLPTIGPEPDDNWRLLNVTNILEILDSERSKYEIYDDGEVGLCQHGYLNQPEPGNRIFEVKDYAPYIFIDETTKQVIEAAGLTGALIRKYINP